MNEKEILKIVEKYNNTNIKWIKNNIFDLLKEKNLNKNYLVKTLKITSHTAHNYVNQAMRSKVPFEIALKICILFNMELDDLVKENNKESIESKKASKKWTEKRKQEFLNDYNSLPLSEVAKKYNLKETSVCTFYSNFSNEMEECKNS